LLWTCMYLKSNDGPVPAALPVHLEYRRVRLLDLNGNDRRLDVQNVRYMKMECRKIDRKCAFKIRDWK
jgi:hypothetical protein